VHLLNPGETIAHLGICSRRKRWILSASSWKYVLVVRPQPGHAITSGENERKPIVCSSS